MIIETDISRLNLNAGELVRLPKAAGVTVALMSGRVWLTQDHDSRDIVLSRGDSFEIEGNDLVLVTAFEPTCVAIIPSVASRAIAAEERSNRARSTELMPEWTGGVGAWMPAWPRQA